MKTQPVEHRSIFARKMARELSEQEIDTIAGAFGGNCSYTFCCPPHQSIDDAQGGCEVP